MHLLQKHRVWCCGLRPQLAVGLHMGNVIAHVVAQVKAVKRRGREAALPLRHASLHALRPWRLRGPDRSTGVLALHV